MSNWHEYFTYEQGKLFWKVSPAKNIKSGREISTVNNTGYLVVKLKGLQYLVHRIVYEMHNGTIPPGMIVDHKDGNPLNNNLENLRLASVSENCCNRGKQKNNSTGFKGVSLHKQSGLFRARICKEGCTKYLGYFSCAEDAYKAYKEASKKFHKSFSKTEECQDG